MFIPLGMVNAEYQSPCRTMSGQPVLSGSFVAGIEYFNLCHWGDQAFLSALYAELFHSVVKRAASNVQLDRHPVDIMVVAQQRLLNQRFFDLLQAFLQCQIAV